MRIKNQPIPGLCGEQRRADGQCPKRKSQRTAIAHKKQDLMRGHDRAQKLQKQILDRKNAIDAIIMAIPRILSFLMFWLSYSMEPHKVPCDALSGYSPILRNLFLQRFNLFIHEFDHFARA